jgi:ferrous iron transport protein A
MRGFMHRFRHGFRHGFIPFRHRFIPEGELVTLARLQPGQGGVVVEILGRHRLTERLAALGIRPGKRITKVSSMLMRGPVTIQVDSAQVAIGFGMAIKIKVKLD